MKIACDTNYMVVSTTMNLTGSNNIMCSLEIHASKHLDSNHQLLSTTRFPNTQILIIHNFIIVIFSTQPTSRKKLMRKKNNLNRPYNDSLTRVWKMLMTTLIDLFYQSKISLLYRILDVQLICRALASHARGTGFVFPHLRFFFILCFLPLPVHMIASPPLSLSQRHHIN